MRRPVTLLLASIEAALFAGQLTTLSSTYWTSWDLRINWTQTLGDSTRRPPSDGQVVSQGHAGLWSRCVRVHGTGKDFNETKLNADKCMSNFDDWEQMDNFKYGRTCKLATAGLCVVSLLLTCLLFALILSSIVMKGTRDKRTRCRWRCLSRTKSTLLILQGVLSALIPVLYLAGNMAEMVEQLTSAYRLLLVVYLQAWYIHDWAYWLQVSLTLLWVFSAGLFSYERRAQKHSLMDKCPGSKMNGLNGADSPELETLRS